MEPSNNIWKYILLDGNIYMYIFSSNNKNYINVYGFFLYNNLYNNIWKHIAMDGSI